MAESLISRAYDSTYGRLFAKIYDRALSKTEEAGLGDRRRELLSAARGDVLELGAGTGVNLAHYPETLDSLTATEPFEPMARQLRAKADGLAFPLEVAEVPAERLPFDDDSFDTVVSTLVLCTVDDPPSALAEAARVLRPGGRLLFLEHVRAEDPKRARWQDRLHGPWYAIGHGCHCNRDTLASIESSALKVERAERGTMPKAPPITRPLLVGEAVAR